MFTEVGQPQQYAKLVASREVDEFLLDALDNYVERHDDGSKSRTRTRPPTEAASPNRLALCAHDRDAQRCRIRIVAAARAVRQRDQRISIKRAGAIGADHNLIGLA
jgi:hypothetical protein